MPQKFLFSTYSRNLNEMLTTHNLFKCLHNRTHSTLASIFKEKKSRRHHFGPVSEGLYVQVRLQRQTNSTTCDIEGYFLIFLVFILPFLSSNVFISPCRCVFVATSRARISECKIYECKQKRSTLDTTPYRWLERTVRATIWARIIR